MKVDYGLDAPRVLERVRVLLGRADVEHRDPPAGPQHPCDYAEAEAEGVGEMYPPVRVVTARRPEG